MRNLPIDQNPNGISRSQSSPRWAKLIHKIQDHIPQISLLHSVEDYGGPTPSSSRFSSSVLKGEKKQFQNRKEKSTGILVGIILVFVLCHIFRLCIQVYEIVSPTHGLHTHFYKCEELKRLHVPAVVLVAGKLYFLTASMWAFTFYF